MGSIETTSNTTTNGDVRAKSVLMDADADSAERLIRELDTHNTHTLPLWAQMTKLNPPVPVPQTVPHIWRYEEVRPYLLRAGQLITEKQAERRVLMLVNPNKEAPHTTDTIYAGLQLVMPNETAPAHRHVAFAMRFIVEGQGGFTTVHGKRVHMQRGDVILTPTWNWHDHGKDGDGPMIWLDNLDLPLFRHFPVHFVEHFKEPRYPADDIDSNESPIVFPWKKMKSVLDGKEGKWCRERYLKEGGKDVSLTLGGAAERLDVGAESPAFKETTSAIYHIIEGEGYSTVGDVKIEWRRSDTFCIPSWMKYQHFNTGGETVYLYRCDDLPQIKSLGFYRKEGDDVESYVS